MKNKGIIVTGGELKATNIIVGENSTINSNDNKNKKATKLSPEKLAQFNHWKVELANGNLKEVIASMLEHFKVQEDKRTLNAVIMHSSSLTQLEMQDNLNVISHEQAKIDRAKITNSVLQLIDNEGYK